MNHRSLTTVSHIWPTSVFFVSHVDQPKLPSHWPQVPILPLASMLHLFIGQPDLWPLCFTYLLTWPLATICYPYWPTWTLAFMLLYTYWPTWPFGSMLHLLTLLTSDLFVTPIYSPDLWPLYFTPIDPPDLWPLCYTCWPTWTLASLLHLLTHLTSTLCYNHWPTWTLASMLHILTHLTSGLYVTPIYSPELWPPWGQSS